MRFVFISTMSGDPWGGSEELWSQAALRLKEEGHEVSVSVVWWPELSPKVTNLARHGIKLFVQPPQLVSWPLRAWRKFQQSLGFNRLKFERLRRLNPDLVVISQGGNADGLEWMQLSREAGLPFVAIIQCNSEAWWPSDKAGIELAAGYQAARKVFCVSQRNLKLLESQIGELLSHAEVVRNPYNIPTGGPLVQPEETGLLKMACVARLAPGAKGQDLLFEVLALPQWRERPIEINLYGEGPCGENLKRIAEGLQLKSVNFRGQIAEVKKIWEENHLLVLPSRYEGLPLVLVEAMWCGCPAVVTDVGGNAEMCVDGETGFVATAPTVRHLAKAMERAWDQRSHLSIMGHAARLRVEKIIPKDPVGLFCQKLKECVSKN